MRSLRTTPIAVTLLATVLLPLVCGCAALGRRGPVPAEVAASRELAREGITAVEMGEWERAEVLLRQSLQTSPSDAQARRYLAETLWRRGATPDALLQIETAARLDDGDAALKVRAGEMLLALSDADKALDHAEAAISCDPNLASAWALRGRVYWQHGEPDRALADLQRSLRYAPTNSDVLLDLAAIYRQQGQPTRALTTVHHLLDTCPPGQEPPLARMLEGLALLDLERPGQAAESFLIASQQGPPNSEVLYYLARARLAAGNYPEATAAAEQALAVNATHEPSRRLLYDLAQRTGQDATLLR